MGTRLYNWILEGNRLRGFISGHIELPDGLYVQTSTIKDITDTDDGYIVTTQSGTVYNLSSCDYNSVWLCINGIGKKVSGLMTPDMKLKISESISKNNSNRMRYVRDNIKNGWMYLRIVGSSVLDAIYKSNTGMIAKIKIYYTDFDNGNIRMENRSYDIETLYKQGLNTIEPKTIKGITGIVIENVGTSQVLIYGIHDIISMPGTIINIKVSELNSL